jgi:hypothetical protein
MDLVLVDYFLRDYEVSLCNEAGSTLGLLFEDASHKFTYLGLSCHCCDQPWALVPKFSLVWGQQRCSLNLDRSFTSPKSFLTLMLTKFT